MDISAMRLFKTFSAKHIKGLSETLTGKEGIESFFNYQDGKAFDAYSNGDYEKYKVRAAKAKDKLLQLASGNVEPESESEAPVVGELITLDESAEPEPDPTVEAEYVGHEETRDGNGTAGRPRVALHVLIAQLIKKRATLFHDSENAGYLRFEQRGHVETHPIESMGFTHYAAHIAFHQFDSSLGSEGMSQLQGILKSEAVFNGKLRKVERRVAHRDGLYYVDLCDDSWQVIEVDPGKGWDVIESKQNPVCFIRSRTARALPVPESGASVDTLWEYVNIPKLDRARVLAWILETFRPETQYPILSLKAQAGSGKTETENTIRLLTDPNQALTSRSPTSTRDVLSNAQNNHILAFDNMSHISDSLSDLFCCMATGTGHRERKYYTNLEELVLQLKRPVMFDSIEFLARRDDLVDRLIHVELPPLKSSEKVGECDFHSQRKEDLPLIFGALLDLFVDVIQRVKSLPAMPGVRMMDYARLGQAVCDSLGLSDGGGETIDFTTELRGHQDTLKHRALEDSPFLIRLVELIADAHTDGANGRTTAGDWFGAEVTKGPDGSICFCQYPGKLLESMAAHAKDVGVRTSSWPTKPNGVLGVLDRNKIALLNLGLKYRRKRVDTKGSLYEFIFSGPAK